MFSLNYSIIELMKQRARLGTLTGKGEYKEKSKFAIELATYVDCDNAGFFAWVTRKSDLLIRLEVTCV